MSPHRYSNLAIVLLLVFVPALVACERRQANYCPTATDHNCLELDAALHGACTGDQDCGGATAVCDVTGAHVCVACTSAKPAACTGTNPVCSADHTCQGCTANAQCGSDVCLPDGSCGEAASVAYVDPGGTDNDSCTKLAPCTKLVKALATNRPYVKLHGTTNEQVSLVNKDVIFLADPGAKLTDTSNGTLLKIDGTSRVAIYDLEISGASGASGTTSPGISLPAGNSATLALTRVRVSGNQGGGILISGGSLTVSQSTISGNQGSGISTSGGSLTISQSTISGNQGSGISTSGGSLTVSQGTIGGNQGSGISTSGGSLTLTRSTIAENHGGGVTMSGPGTLFTITDNFIYRNDNASSASAGGLSVLSAGASKLERNTIVDNQARVATTSAGGVLCDQVGFVAAHNLIFRNTGGPTGNVQTLGVCSYGDSLSLAGTSNVDNSLGFAHPNAAPFDYHLTAASPASVVDAAGACTGVDFDGEARPSGTACDLGADEYRP
jgi:hypothetical protein